MHLIEKLFGKIGIYFTWKGNQKKIAKQTGEGLQVQQDKNSVTNIFQIKNITVSSIEDIASIDNPQDSGSFLKSAGKRFLIEQNTRQENLNKTVAQANLNKIKNPQEVEKDWFMKWMEISQTISKDDIQNMLAKILSGEVVKTGSFSLRTLDILKNLSKQELVLFQKFCDISFSIPQIGDSFTCVISEPFGNPSNNDMSSLDLSYSNLSMLQDAGLIQTDLSAWREFIIPGILQIPFVLGSSVYTLKSSKETTSSKPHVKIIIFTSAGLELRRVLNLGVNKEYNAKFLEWVDNKFKMIPN